MAEIDPNSSFETFMWAVLRLYGRAVVGLVAYQDHIYVNLVTHDN